MKSALNRKLPEMQISKNYNALESLRGIAAFIVVMGHLNFYGNYLDRTLVFNLFKGISFDSHLAVLIFFCLSGYVIGLSTKPLTNLKEILLYAKKRWVRIYPIFIMTIGILIPITYVNGVFSLKIFQDYIFFIFGIFRPIFMEANPLWSLQYEMVFYIIFIPISFYKIRVLPLAFATLILGFVNIYFFNHYYTEVKLFSILFGFSFWLFGLYFSKFKINSESNTEQVFAGNLVILFCFGIFASLISNLRIDYLDQFFLVKREISWVLNAINLHDLYLIPFCLYLLVNFSNSKHFLNSKIGRGIIFSWPLLKYGPPILDNPIKYFSQFRAHFWVYIFSLFLLTNNYFSKQISKIIFSITTYLGSISYAMYVFHFPILSYFTHINYFSQMQFGLEIKFTLYLLALILASHIAERIIQPRIKAIFFKPKAIDLT